MSVDLGTWRPCLKLRKLTPTVVGPGPGSVRQAQAEEFKKKSRTDHPPPDPFQNPLFKERSKRGRRGVLGPGTRGASGVTQSSEANDSLFCGPHQVGDTSNGEGHDRTIVRRVGGVHRGLQRVRRRLGIKSGLKIGGRVGGPRGGGAASRAPPW